jgi:hypothetical protein
MSLLFILFLQIPYQLIKRSPNFFYPKGMKIVVKESRLVKSKNNFIFIGMDNPLSVERVESFFPSPSNVTDTINAKFEQWFGDGDHAHKKNGTNVFEITPDPNSTTSPDILDMNRS